MKKINFFLFIIIFIFVSIGCFARDGQIDIEELIRRKEAENQSLEKISSALNQITEKDKNELTKKINPFLNNDDDEIVKFDDSSDEINLEYFINIFNDNVVRKAVIDSINKVSEYIKNKTEQTNEIELPYSLIPFIFSILSSLIICSISTISGKEASVFPMVIKDTESDWKSVDKKLNNLEENKIIPLQVRKYRPAKDSKNPNAIADTLEDTYGYDYDSWMNSGQQALLNLESFSNNNEFKNVYNHFKKKRVVYGRILDEALAEADDADKVLIDIEDKNNSLLSLLIKSRLTNKVAGDDINANNSMLEQTDLAYITVFSDNTEIGQKADNANDFWAGHAWV
jgi:hypothetical protein